jgi:hypothetical protein
MEAGRRLLAIALRLHPVEPAMPPGARAINNRNYRFGPEFGFLLQGAAWPAAKDENGNAVHVRSLRHAGKCGRKRRLWKGESSRRAQLDTAPG